MRKKFPKFGRRKNQRKALLWSLVTDLVLYENIRTTSAKARNCVVLVNKLFSKVKDKDKLEQIRVLAKHLKSSFASKKFIDVLLPMFDGKTNIASVYKLGFKREGDGSSMCIVKINK